MNLETPVIANCIAKDTNAHSRYLASLEHLAIALRDKKIYNIEYNDMRHSLKYWGIERALDVVVDENREAFRERYEYNNDICGYCDFNQAAGRVKRLVKLPASPVLDLYIGLLKEIAALNEACNSLKPYIVKGRRPNQNKTEAQIALELKNTGICAICGSRQKLSADKLVHHGYKMSDYNHSGYRMGKCFGTDYLCYELSNEANVAFAPVLKSELKGVELALETLPKLTEFEIEESEWNHKTHRSDKKRITVYKTGPTAEKFDREFEYRKHRLESEIRSLKDDIKTNNAKIKGWTKQPLKYGR